jgi:hypothetical protein
MMIDFQYMGDYSTANFGEGVTQNKKGQRDYVEVDFQGKGGVGKAKIKRPTQKEIVRNTAWSAGLGGGAGHLLVASKGGGTKSKLLGTAIGAAITGGAAYMGSKRGIFAKDADGRSDKGKKRK